MPPDKSLHCRIFGQPQLRIQAGCIGISVFSTLPELTAIATLERHHVLLRLVNKDTKAFLHHLVRAHGDGHSASPEEETELKEHRDGFLSQEILRKLDWE